jgi:hypothetical protein
MATKSLYYQEGVNDQRYTPEAEALDQITHNALRPIFEQYLGYGYGPREVSHLMSNVLKGLEYDAVLDIGASK